MHGRAAAWCLVVAWAAGCGAKTGLAEPDAAAEPAGIDAGIDAMVPRDSGVDAGRDAAPDADAGPPLIDACTGDLRLSWSGEAPTVMLLIDGSSSMGMPFAGLSSRWTVLRTALVGLPDGLLVDLEDEMRFGFTSYSGGRHEMDMGPMPGPCPTLRTVPPALNNFDTIRTVYGTADVGVGTPTGDAIDAVVESLLASGDPRRSTTVIVLATDGEPYSCDDPDPEIGRERALAAAEHAFEEGIPMFIISVGEGEVSLEHLQDMANAGAGVAPGDPDAPFWDPRDRAALLTALREVVGERLSCTLPLEAPIDASRACRGSLSLNGRPLDCESDDGWRAADASHIEILGAACDELRSSPTPTVVATFPCDVRL